MARQTRRDAFDLSDDDLRSEYNNLIRMMRTSADGALPEQYNARKEELKAEAYDRGIELSTP
jgi:hypothetical protein